MKKLIVISYLASVSAIGLLALVTPKEKLIPVLLVDGQSGGPYHAWQLTTSVLKRELEETGLFQVTVATSPQFGGDFSNFKPKFTDYKAIVWNYDAPDWPADLRQQLEEYVKNGGGLVIVHAADNAFPDWRAFNQMIGIGGWRNRSEKSGPALVLQRRQTGLRHVSGFGRFTRSAHSFPSGHPRTGPSNYEGLTDGLDARSR